MTMAITVSCKNTFLTIEDRLCCFSSKRRSHSEETFRRIQSDTRTYQHLEQLWCEQVVIQDPAPLDDDVQVFQSNRMPQIGFNKNRPLGKMRPISSLSSVSTMTSDEDVDSMSKFGSSNSLSSMTWCDEEDEFLSSDDSASCHQQTIACDNFDTQATPKDSKHSAVPRHVNLEEEFAKIKKEGQAITTLMIRNIPNRCSQREVIGELERVGLAGCFDFVYVPLDLGTMSNVGYAFVNFIHPAFAAFCAEVLPRHQFSRQRKSGKPVAVSPAHMQGLEANLRHYEKSAVNTSRLRQRRPVVLR